MYPGEDNSSHRQQKIQKECIGGVQGTARKLMWLEQSEQGESNKRGSQRGSRQYEDHGRAL